MNKIWMASILATMALPIGLATCAHATHERTGTSPSLRAELARRYGCAPGSVDDTARAPILTWYDIGVGTTPCELLAHYPAVPLVRRLTGSGGLLREQWEFYYGNPTRGWNIRFEGVTRATLRAVQQSEPQVR